MVVAAQKAVSQALSLQAVRDATHADDKSRRQAEEKRAHDKRQQEASDRAIAERMRREAEDADRALAQSYRTSSTP